MDRINNFLKKRSKKNERNLKVYDKKYTITKDDLKLVRAYCRGKNITGTKLPIVHIPSEEVPVIISQKKLYNDQLAKMRFLKKYEQKMVNTMATKNEEIYDIYENEKLSDYEQEWIYDVSVSYNKPVDQLETNNIEILQELGKQYRTPIEKTVSLNEFKHYKHLNYDFGIYRQHTIQSTSSNFTNEIITKIDDNIVTYNGFVYDIKYGSIIVDTNKYISQFYINNDRLYKNNTILAENIKNFVVHKNNIYALQKNIIKIFSKTSIHIEDYKFKTEVHQVYIDNNILYVCHANGLSVVNENKKQCSIHLNYVIDCKVRNCHVFAITNTSKLVYLVYCSDTLTKITEISLGDIGEKIDVYEHNEEWLVSVLFNNTVCIYSMKKNQHSIIPCSVINVQYQNIFWHSKHTVLYCTLNNKIFGYS